MMRFSCSLSRLPSLCVCEACCTKVMATAKQLCPYCRVRAFVTTRVYTT